MKVPFSWLKEWLSADWTIESVVDALTSLGLEVEGIERVVRSSRTESVCTDNGAVELSVDRQILPVEEVLIIALTPNLGHCLSILGIARELAAYSGQGVRRSQVSVEIAPAIATVDHFQVHIEDPLLCQRYGCWYVDGTSPTAFSSSFFDFLRARLEAAGIKSINALVDAGNYTMLELGQPVHIFDAEKIVGRDLYVGPAKSRGQMLALDGRTYIYPPGTLLVRDAKHVLAIAGVIGGASSAVSATTKNVLVEAACFSPQSIRDTSKLLSVHTESSHRFERGTDKGATLSALEGTVALIQRISGGRAARDHIDVCPVPSSCRVIPLRVDRCNALLGARLSVSEVVAILERLEMRIYPRTEQILVVEPPTYRNDLCIEEDLLEEVARLYGYNNISRAPEPHAHSPIGDAPIFVFEEKCRQLLLAQGLQECITCDLISPDQAECVLDKGISHEALIHVLHPRSIDQSVLRPSLLPGLLSALRINQCQRNFDVPACEIGKIHYRQQGRFIEKSVAGILLAGLRAPHHWNPRPTDVDFFDLKGIMELFFASLHIRLPNFIPSHLHIFSPCVQAKMYAGDQMLGMIGGVHPNLLEKWDIAGAVYYAELNLHELFPLLPVSRRTQPLPTFPGSERDWTVSVSGSTPLETIFQEIRSIAPALLVDFFLQDLYVVGEEKKNVTLRFVYRDPLRTLEMQEIEIAHHALIHQVMGRLRILTVLQ